VQALLREKRLVTLTGAGGIGKTRLALMAAAKAVSDFRDGVWFVPLASVTDPALVPSVIAETLGLVPVQGDRRTPLEMVADHVRDRDVLLVLDNFEQVLDAAASVNDLLRASDRLKVVVTSRSSLRVYGEHEFGVPPLGLPDPRHLPDLAALSQYEAVALLIDRATAVRPDFRVTNENAPAVAEITARLDGLPLAIELAAARIRLLTPDQILARLGDRLGLLATGSRDLPARQQTLRGAIAWSHDLLTRPEQRLFARMAVFMGGCTLDHAEMVCGPSSELGVDVVEGMTSLVEKSLLTVREGDPSGARFGMLETIREFAVEELEGEGEAEEIRRRHAEAYVTLVEHAEPELTRSEGKRWLDRLEPEHDNIRASLDWTLSRGSTELALRMVGAVWRFWQMRGHLREATGWIERVLALPDTDAHPRARVRALLAAGGTAYWSLDTPNIGRYYDQALVGAEALGDQDLLAEALYNSAWSGYGPGESGDFVPTAERAELSLARLEQSLALFEAIGDRAGMAKANWGLGDFAFLTPGGYDLDRSRVHLERARDLAAQVDDSFTLGWALYLLGGVSRQEGDPQDAGRLYRAALRIFDHANDVTGIVFGLEGLAATASMLGDPQRALRLRGAAAGVRAQSGARLFDFMEDPALSSIGLPDDEAARARSEGEAMTLQGAIAYALEGG